MSKPNTPAQVAASRANGAKGGRPTDRLPDDVMSRLGDVPDEPFARCRWMQGMLIEVARLTATGLITKDLAESLRATASAFARALPMDLIVEVEGLLRQDRDTIAADDTGPELEEVRDAQSKQAVRRNPS